MMKIISICPENSGEILRGEILNRIYGTLTLLLSCPDEAVRRWTSRLVTHLILVYINQFDVQLDPTFELKEDDIEKNPDFLNEPSNLVMTILTRMKGFKLDSSYKRMGPYFHMWYKLVLANDNIAIWMISKAKIIAPYLGNFVFEQTSSWTRPKASTI
jgi:hypothetical protein